MSGRWQCSVCSYVHNGDEPPAFCPVCGADRSKFVRLAQETAAKPHGLWSTFKIHPIAAHFPGGLLPTAAFFLLLCTVFGLPEMEAAAFWLVVVATLVVPVSIGSGLYDWQRHHAGRKAAIFRKKIGLAVTLLGLGALAIALRWDGTALLMEDGWRWWLYLFTVPCMLACVTLLGHYGSILVTQRNETAPGPGENTPRPVQADVWYATILAQSPDAILAADQTGVIRLWNQGAERIFGVPADQAIGQTLDLIIPENLRQRHWEGWGKVMRTGESRYGADEYLRVPALRADGSRFSAEFSLVMLKDQSGTVTGVAALLRDVTAQWEKEKLLRAQLESCMHKLDGG